MKKSILDTRYFVNAEIEEDNSLVLDISDSMRCQINKEVVIKDNSVFSVKDNKLVISNVDYREYNLNRTDEILEKTFADIDKRIKEAKEILDKKGIIRTLHIISLSDDEASKSYMNRKVEQGKKYGVPVIIHRPKDSKELHDLILKLKSDINNRVIIQKPYDEELWGRTDELLSLLPKFMDVDGFSMSLLDLSYVKTYEDLMEIPTFSPTAKGVVSIMNNIVDTFKYKTVTVIGKGLTSGMPIATALQQLGCTILWLNSTTDEWARTREMPSMSDFVISCAGVPNILREGPNLNYCKPKCFINVGMSKDENGKLQPDIDSNKFNHPNMLFCNKLFGTTGKLTTMNLILNTLL